MYIVVICPWGILSGVVGPCRRSAFSKTSLVGGTDDLPNLSLIFLPEIFQKSIWVGRGREKESKEVSASSTTIPLRVNDLPGAETTSRTCLEEFPLKHSFLPQNSSDPTGCYFLQFLEPLDVIKHFSAQSWKRGALSLTGFFRACLARGVYRLPGTTW